MHRPIARIGARAEAVCMSVCARARACVSARAHIYHIICIYVWHVHNGLDIQYIHEGVHTQTCCHLSSYWGYSWCCVCHTVRTHTHTHTHTHTNIHTHMHVHSSIRTRIHNIKHGIHYTPIAIEALIGVKADAACVTECIHARRQTHTHTYIQLYIRVFIISNMVYTTDLLPSQHWLGLELMFRLW